MIYCFKTSIYRIRCGYMVATKIVTSEDYVWYFWGAHWNETLEDRQTSACFYHVIIGICMHTFSSNGKLHCQWKSVMDMDPTSFCSMSLDYFAYFEKSSLTLSLKYFTCWREVKKRLSRVTIKLQLKM